MTHHFLKRTASSPTFMTRSTSLALTILPGGSRQQKRPSRRRFAFVPMQAKTGDYALFFRKAAVEITFEGDRYLVVPQAAILALVREE